LPLASVNCRVAASVEWQHGGEAAVRLVFSAAASTMIFVAAAAGEGRKQWVLQ
jgi:hypothetical protein